MADESIDNMKRIAYHEAGHVVINLLMGLPFQTVSLKMEEEKVSQIEKGKKVDVILTYTVGTVFSQERLYSINKTLMSGVLDIKEALSLMGGPIAEMMLVGKWDEQVRLGAREDLQAIPCCCRVAMSGSDKPEDWTQYPEMEQSMITAISIGVNHLLKDNWPIVEAFAEILVEKQELDYAEAVSFAEAKGPLKKG